MVKMMNSIIDYNILLSISIVLFTLLIPIVIFGLDSKNDNTENNKYIGIGISLSLGMTI